MQKKLTRPSNGSYGVCNGSSEDSENQWMSFSMRVRANFLERGRRKIWYTNLERERALYNEGKYIRFS